MVNRKDQLNLLLLEGNFKELQEKLSRYNPIDIGEYIEDLDIRNATIVFRLLQKDLAIEVFSNMSPKSQSILLDGLTDIEIQELLDDLFFDDMVDLVEEMPAGIVKKILRYSDQEERSLINQFLQYPKDSAGSLMTIEYVELRKTQSIKEALNIIKSTGLDKVTVYTCYVTDEKKKLLGYVSLRNLVIADDTERVGDLIDEDIIFVNTHDDQEIVANVFSKYGFVALPVVDNEERITGIITVDDIIDVIEEENTEDFHRMAAINPDRSGYLEASVLQLAKNRVTWLLILMVSATFTGKIMNRYNLLIQSMITLNMFVPMIMDTGGNSGSQSSTMVIRAIATGEIEPGDTFKVIWKEFRVSLIAGFILASVNMVKCLFIDQVSLTIALLVSITLMFTVTTAKIIGGILPIIAKKINVDPATMAAPLITTVVDSLSLIIYFELISYFL